MRKGLNYVFDPQWKVVRIAGSLVVNCLAGDHDGWGG